MQEFKVDYHIHTSFSDGKATPAQIVKQAKQMEYDIISITDLNTIDGLQEAMIAAEAVELKLVTGVEIPAENEDGISQTLLGYGFDREDPELNAFLDRLKTGETPQAAEVIGAIAKAGGMPVLAHPIRTQGLGEPGSEAFFAGLEASIARMKKQGLKGLECFHPDQNEKQAMRLIELAEKYHLHITQGTDFRGSDYTEAVRTGNYK